MTSICDVQINRSPSLPFWKRQFSGGTDLWSMSVDVGFGIQLRKIQAFFLVKSVKFPCKIVFLAFESRSKWRLRQPSHGWEGSADRRAAGTDTKQNLGKTPSHAKVYKVGGHGVVTCVSLSSSFPARPSPVAFLVRPPSPTLCSSRSPPPTVAPSLRRSNHHVIQIWQARNSNLAGDDYRSGSPRRGLNAGTGPP